MIDKQEIKKLLPNYLSSLGIDYNKNFCCLVPGHSDKTPSMIYRKNSETVKCFGCGFFGDVINLIGEQYGISNSSEAFVKAAEILLNKDFTKKINTQITAQQKKPKKKLIDSKLLNFSNLINKAHSNVNQTNYFKLRGISQKNINKYRLGYIKSLNQIVLPIENYYYIKRNIAKKQYYNMPDFILPIFNEKYIHENKDTVFVTEGIIDAITIEEYGYYAIATNSADNIYELIKIIEKNKFNGKIIIAFDQDYAGEIFANKLQENLTQLEIENQILILKNFKDINQAHLANTLYLRSTLNNIFQNLKE
ncbi:MAG: toprim domain-containing protein [Patescibacteria group bacterium]